MFLALSLASFTALPLIMWRRWAWCIQTQPWPILTLYHKKLFLPNFPPLSLCSLWICSHAVLFAKPLINPSVKALLPLRDNGGELNFALLTFKALKHVIWKPQQWHIFPERLSQLPWIIQRPLCELLLLLPTKTNWGNEPRVTAINWRCIKTIIAGK